MKGTAQLKVACLVFGLLQCVHAVTFLMPHEKTALAKIATNKKTGMPVTTHNKSSGGGYEPGSPLFDKQEKRKVDGKLPTPPAKPGTWSSGLSWPSFPRFSSPDLTSPDIAHLQDQDPTKYSLMKDATAKGDLTEYLKSVGGWEGHLWHGLYTFLSVVVFWTLIGLIWHQGMAGRVATGYGERERRAVHFDFTLFDKDHVFNGNYHHLTTCCCAFFCSPIRMADTYAKEPNPVVAGFWTALLLILVLSGADHITFGLSGLILFVLVLVNRQTIRKHYSMPTGGQTWVWDCCTWFWCPCCAIAQEARQVEYVTKTGPPDQFAYGVKK